MSRVFGIVLVGLVVTACVALASISFVFGDVESLRGWLATPISGSSRHEIVFGVAWHGRLMVVAWAILMPVGLIIARFYKIMPGQDWPRELDNPFWFVNHRRLGYAIGILTIVAVAFVVWSRGGQFLWHSHHAITGWTMSVLAIFQIVGALLRGTHGGPIDPFTRQSRPPERWPGDHFSLTRRRIFFEYSHKLVGYLLVFLAAWTIVSGLYTADAPRWMWMSLVAWTLFCVGLFVHLQRKGKCIDTYQAIWGLDDTLPGYRRKPIGWGITRVNRKSPDDK